MSLHDAVEKYVHDNDVLCLGGFTTNRKPYAAVYEILRQGKTGFVGWSGPAGGDWDSLIGEGRVRAYINCYTANSGYTNVARRFRAAIEKGELTYEDYSQDVLMLQLHAASLGLPYLPVRMMQGSGLVKFWGISEEKRKTMEGVDNLKCVDIENPFEPGEKVTAGITVHEFDEDYLVFVTRNGTVKRLELASLNTARKAGIRALTLSEGDELIAVMKTDGKQDIMLASADGMAICFNENDVRVMGRDAAGVRGMALDAGDSIVGAGIAAKGKQLLSVTEYGYGKRTDIEEYMRLGDDGVRRPQQRGGKGLKNYNITAKTGRIAGVAIVDDEDDVMLIENGGVLIRMAAADINVYKRDTQGVILMRVEAGNRVISVDRVDREPEETADEHEEA